MQMQFIDYDVGFLDAGKIVRVNLDRQANVQLVDDANLSLYRANRPFRAKGGRMIKSPANIVVPSAGRWHLIIDCGVQGGRIRPGVKVLN